MNPAPKVVKRTPKRRAFVGFDLANTMVIKAVKTTYRDVKKADTDGVMSSRPIICVTKPTSMMMPSMNPPLHCSDWRKAALAFEKAKKYAKENAIPFIDGRELYEFSKVR